MKDFIKSPYFLIGLAVKFILLFSFAASEFPKDLFIPFFDRAVIDFGTNPWSLSPPHYFPYGSVLFVILFIPKYILYLIFGELALGTTPLSIFALKAPLLILDFVLLSVLLKLSGPRAKSLLWLYWLNPVLIYITYVYGQLDVASMSFLFLSLFALVNKKTAHSALWFAAATLCKFHVIAALPFLLVYIWNRDFKTAALNQIAKWLMIWTPFTLVGFLPAITAHTAAHATLGSPEIARLLSAQLVFTESHALFLGVFLTLLVLGRLVISTKITELGLIFGTGVIFSTLLVSSHAAPGWFYWALPFFALFYSLYLNVPRLLFWALNFSYFLPFLVAPELETLLPKMLVNSAATTVLHTVLFANIVALWLLCVRREAMLTGRAQPIKIGIAGDSGSGKNQLTLSLEKLFGKVLLIEGDNYHKWERGDEQWRKYTHLNPKANLLFALNSHMSQITRGRPVYQPLYNHETGRFTQPVEFLPERVLVVQGLHTFYLRPMREAFDINVFLNPEPLVRKAWKIQRDCNTRGYDKQKVLSQLEHRENDSLKYITAQREHADLIIEHFTNDNFTEAQALNGETPQTSIRFVAYNEIDFSPLASLLAKAGVKCELELQPQSLERVVLTTQGQISGQDIQTLSEQLIPNMRHLTRGREAPNWSPGLEGITQLVILWVLYNKKASKELV